MFVDYNPYNPVPYFEERALEKYLNVEEEFMAAAGYADSKEAILRRNAMHVILRNSKCENFEAFTPYLALNYFDRFISRNPLPNVLERVRDEIVLVANCCLMLAWKMRHRTFNVLEFLARTNMIEHQRHILKVELAILNGLNWRLRAVTAICFVDMFARRIPVAKQIKRRSMNQIIIQAQGDITFTKFKPSVIAAAALLSACRLKHRQFYDLIYDFLVASEYFKGDDLNACNEKIFEMCVEKHIFIEGDVLGPRVGEKSQAEESSSQISHGPGKEPMEGTSEIQEIDVDREFVRRPGKEPVSEIQEEPLPVPTSDNYSDQMNFELKWLLWSSDPVEITIDSPLFRPVAEAVAAETTSAKNDNPPRGRDRNVAVSCCPVQCVGCSFL